MFRRVLDRFDSVLSLLERTLVMFSGLSILAMLFVTALDVGMRYFLHAPLRWAFDVVSLYLLGATFFFAFPYALAQGGHIKVDYFAEKMPKSIYSYLMFFGFIASAVFVGTIAWFGMHEVISAWRHSDVVAGTILWPVWIAKIALPFSMIALCLRSVEIAFKHLLNFHCP